MWFFLIVLILIVIILSRKKNKKAKLLLIPKEEKKANDNLNLVSNLIKKSDSDMYLESFKNIKEYDINKLLDDKFLIKIKRSKEIGYDEFIKYNGTTKRPIDFVVFDLETTGLNPTAHEIIEIGAIRFIGNEPKEIFHTYVKPKKRISAKITGINGITNEMVENSPSIEYILPKFIDFIGDDILIAHNAEFDMEFILNQLYNLGYGKIKNKVIDTLKLSRQKIRDYDPEKDRDVKLESYSLEYLKDRFFLSEIPSHNSIDDCKVCAYIYMKIVNEDGDICYTEY